MLKYLDTKWQQVSSTTSEVDLTFLVLRVLSLAGGLAWLIAAPLSPVEKKTLTSALIFFSMYSLACYCIIFIKPAWLRRVYIVSLFLDLFFISHLVHIEPELENSFFIGYYLLVCLHTIYFGLRLGLAVATISAILYFASIFHHLAQYAWTELALRMAFLFLIAGPVGLLSEKVKRDKTLVEELNRELARSLENLKEMQEKLVDAEKFSALGRMTAYITHEIRNPLTAVGGFARRLEKKLPPASSEKEYASVIIQEVTRLEKILLDTLIYGKEHDLRLIRNDINLPVTTAASLYRDLCREQNITLEEQFTPALPHARIDIEQVQQALDSLISNSMQAMPQGGSLAIRTGQEEKYNTTFLTIRVSDSGGGIDSDSLEYIFEPFYSTKKIGLGTGLGLPIVKKIMDEHRGLVEIDNRPGQGMEVSLFFPYQSEEQDKMIPCWEYLRCGIETDTKRRCGAFPHFGRICWSTAGSFSAKNREGICAQKIENCADCIFYKIVNTRFPIYLSS